MMNSTAYESAPQCLNLRAYQEVKNTQQDSTTNRFIYVKKPISGSNQSSKGLQTKKVLVNPHFKAKNEVKSKVFVNPNFSAQTVSSKPAIHINPRLRSEVITHAEDKVNLGCSSSTENTSLRLPLHSTKIHINPSARNTVQLSCVSQTVHINPKFSNISGVVNTALNTVAKIATYDAKENVPDKKCTTLVLTKTKLVRLPRVVESPKKFKRRNSVKSNYKIVKSAMSPKKSSTVIGKCKTTEQNSFKNRFKIDNRRIKSLSIICKHQKKYVFVNKVNPYKTGITKQGISSKLSRNHGIINTNRSKYRKLNHPLRRTSSSVQVSNRTTLDIQNKISNKPSKEMPKKVNSESKRKIIKKFKIIRKESLKNKVKISSTKLKKCNIPCLSYNKYGICKGKDNGKCIWKHDPSQVALCTRFLQGACLKENCLLSHNVSPEKMPTCKYYLEGSCSRETCPYLHVKISPKAEVCRDFLEGFCKKAAECEKRHQYLCPDHEKHGKCVKQRCPYPHGKMVRTYLINKNKFAKKYSDPKFKKQNNAENLAAIAVDTKIQKTVPVVETRRYYTDSGSKSAEASIKSTVCNAECSGKEETNLKNFVGLQSRPKLGSLPSFIPFGSI